MTRSHQKLCFSPHSSDSCTVTKLIKSSCFQKVPSVSCQISRHTTKTSSLLLRLPSPHPSPGRLVQHGRWATPPALPPSPQGHHLPGQEFLPGLLSWHVLSLHCYHSTPMIPKTKSECPCAHISRARQDSHPPVTLLCICTVPGVLPKLHCVCMFLPQHPG